jgi:hypothetical protein
VSWFSILMLIFVAYASCEVWTGLAAGEMQPLGVVGGSYLNARRASNPVGFWLATAFNISLIGVWVTLILVA